ncbi:MAG TPA: hypothetical protein VKY19_14370 [Ktedonosporobacter sp.]|nr:hypothetical protein [Ktedonosporobacter sp.]
MATVAMTTHFPGCSFCPVAVPAVEGVASSDSDWGTLAPVFPMASGRLSCCFIVMPISR